MVDAINNYREEISDGDLDLKNKFLKGGAGVEKVATPGSPKSGAEVPPTPETQERKEGRMEKDDVYASILAKAKQPTTVAQHAVSADAKNVSEETDYESKITKLVAIAESQGVLHAVKVARHLEDNYILDELHDRLLAEDLHLALVRKGMITEV